MSRTIEKRSLRLAAFLCALSFASTLQAAEGWWRITSPHFELFTDAGENRGREAIAYFEQARSFFEKASPVSKPSDFPVRLILFRDPATFAAYRPNNYAIAYYFQSQTRDYIVMGQSDEAVFRIALHEYMHLMVRHSGLKIPSWLNEGWAEVYSTMRPLPKGGVAVGDLIEPRVQQLAKDDWLRIQDVFHVGPGSPLYNEATRVSMFYSESWALVHMLYLAPDYRAGFSKFINSINQGKTAEESLWAAWNKSPIVVFADLQAYFRRKSIQGVVFEVKLDKPAELPISTQLPTLQADLMFADLLLSGQRFAEAQALLERIQKTSPGDSDLSRTIGYAAWAQGHPDDAIANFERAAKSGNGDPQMYFHLAMLSRAQKLPLSKAQEALAQAVTLKPDYLIARLELVAILLAQSQPQASLEVLAPIKEIDADHAATFFNELAIAYAMLGNPAKAKTNAERAQKAARTDLDRKQSAATLAWVAAHPDGK